MIERNDLATMAIANVDWPKRAHATPRVCHTRYEERAIEGPHHTDTLCLLDPLNSKLGPRPERGFFFGQR